MKALDGMLIEDLRRENDSMKEELVSEKKARQLAEDRLCSILFSPFMANQTCRDIKAMQEAYTDARLERDHLRRQLALEHNKVWNQRPSVAPALVTDTPRRMAQELAVQFYNYPANQQRAVELILEKLQPSFAAGVKLRVERNQTNHLLRQVFYARNPLGLKFCDELAYWHLDDLEQELVQLLEGQHHDDETKTV